MLPRQGQTLGLNFFLYVLLSQSARLDLLQQMTLLGFFPTTLYRGAGRDSIPRQSVDLHQTGTFRTLYRLSYSAAAICYKLGFAKAANLSIQFIVGCSRALK